MDELIQQMKKALAETFALYLKAQYFHWNVEGPNFQQFHDFFGNFYEEVYGAIDPMAEEIRALDAYAPGSFERFAELSEITGETTVPSPLAMISRLAEDNTRLSMTLKQVRDTADGMGFNGLVNFLEDRMDQHAKHAWMLRSYGKSV